MPDTCLDTTPSQSLDVRLLKVAEWAAKKSVDEHSRGMLATSRITQQRSDELVAIACSVRATAHRPSQRAADLIQLLRAAPTEAGTWAVLVDCATTLRCLSDADQLRVVREALIAVARQREPGL